MIIKVGHGLFMHTIEETSCVNVHTPHTHSNSEEEELDGNVQDTIFAHMFFTTTQSQRVENGMLCTSLWEGKIITLCMYHVLNLNSIKGNLEVYKFVSVRVTY